MSVAIGDPELMPLPQCLRSCGGRHAPVGKKAEGADRGVRCCEREHRAGKKAQWEEVLSHSHPNHSLHWLLTHVVDVEKGRRRDIQLSTWYFSLWTVNVGFLKPFGGNQPLQ